MILKYKTRRNKPLYKKFILLRNNIQNRKRLNLFKFRKKKWRRLIIHLKRLRKRRRKNFPLYDLSRHFVPKFSNLFKYKHNYKLQTNKKFKLFYGGLLRKYIKKRVSITLKQKNKLLKKNFNLPTFFLNSLEKRLDVVLYRSHFTSSVRLSRQLILHKHIKVNKIVIQDCSFNLKKGDLIEVCNKGIQLVEYCMQNSHMWPIPPKYLNINYRILQIIYNNNNKDYQNVSNFFPFWLDLFTIIRNHR